MKRTTGITLAICLCLGVAVEAEAGTRQYGKAEGPARTEMPPDYLQPHKFTRLPQMQFCSGRLQRDNFGGWRLGAYELQISSTTIVTDQSGDSALLEEGREVIVMGVVFGQTLAGWNVRMTSTGSSLSLSGTEAVKRPSNADPDVGEIVDGPR